MITCKACQKNAKYEGKVCKSCGAEIVLSEKDISEWLLLSHELTARKKYTELAECHHVLADAGVISSMREYARILEKGELREKSIPLAMEYYLGAARGNDSYSAYRYACLVSRTSDSASRFWLVYSAILGCNEAYAPAARLMSDFSREEEANYFYTLAARCADTAATVTLAQRYYDGIGGKSRPEYAKWYLGTLKIPPLSALKLALKLRQVTPREPIEADVITYGKILRSLFTEAQRLNIDSALYRLSTLLADRDDMDALAMLGILTVCGRACEKNPSEGIKLLIKAAESDNMRAALFLGGLFSKGEITPRDMTAALNYYEEAGALGSAEAYEALGDIFLEGELVERNISDAVYYYDLSANLGSDDAEMKSNRIKAERERLYNEAFDLRETDLGEAFKKFDLSASMGHLGAIFSLAICYLDALGCAADRRKAYNLFKDAAELGYNEALIYLGRCYEFGIGTRLDYKRAKSIFLKAKRLGISSAEDELISMMRHKLDRERDRLYSMAMRLFYKKKFGAAKRYIEIAKDLGHPKAIYTLGCLYEFGMGVECDKTHAFELYEEAYALKFRDPRARYKQIILKMLRRDGGFVKNFE